MKSIVTWPNDILTKKLAPVGMPDSNTKEIAKQITKALLTSGGLGLTANQVGYDVAMFSMWHNDSMLVVLDPQVTATRGDLEKKKEGCLSLPGVTAQVARRVDIDVTYTDLEGVIQTKTLTGLSARVFQHELDHTQGIMIFDRLPKVLKAITLDKYYKNIRR